MKLIEQVIHEEPTPPHKFDRAHPRDLETIVLKALAKEPGQRYTTAEQMAEDLRRFAADRPILARRIGPAERTWRWCKRNPMLAGAAGAVAASLVAMALISVIYATEQARAADEIRGLAADLGKERESLRKSLGESNRLLAIRNFDRGQAAFEKGEIALGMHWMIESWRSSVDAGDPAWQHAARANLAAWRAHYPRLKGVLSHTMPVHSAAFGPDSRTVISGGIDGTAQLWDSANFKRIGSPLQQGGEWIRVGFSADGKTAFTFSEGKPTRLWDATTGEPLGHPLPLPPEVHILTVAIQPERKIVLAGVEGTADGIVRFWDAATCKPIDPPLTHHGHVYPPVFSPDSRIILTPSVDGTAWLWDVATCQPIGLPLKHQGGFWSAAFSLDGKTILTGSRDGTAELWDAATSQPLGPALRHDSEVRSVAFSPDGKTILTGCQDKDARLWDVATGQLIGLLGHQGGITAVAFSPDGRSILTGSLDGTVRLWDASPRPPVGPVREIPTMDSLHSVSPDGKVLLTLPRWANPRYTQLWNATTGRPIGTRLPQPGVHCDEAFSPDGKVVLTIDANAEARLWDATTGVALGAAVRLPSPVLPEGASSRLGPDGKTVLFMDKDLTIWICDGATGTVRGHTPVLGARPYGLEFSPDGKTFFTGLANGEARLWNVATGTPLGDPIRNTAGAIIAGKFSPDGKSLLLACEDGSVRLWDLANRKQLISPLRHPGPVSGLEFSPDGKILATAASRQSRDKTRRLWDVATGQPIGPVRASLIPSEEGVSAPDLPDELERVAAWVEVITGLTLDKQEGQVWVLDNAAWLGRRDRLTRLGGPPETGPEQRLDPITLGPDPTARAKSFMERKQWDAAEAAFDEAARARPFNLSIVGEWGDLYVRRGLWKEAAAYYARAVNQYPDVALLHYQLAIARLIAGDLPGYGSACTDMFERFNADDDPLAANRLAYAGVYASNALTNMPAFIRVCERSVPALAGGERVVGAALYRAGRYDQALERFQQSHKVIQPRAWDWLFLAMIHSRLGHPSEAGEFLRRANQWIAEADKAPSTTEKTGPSWMNLIERPTILILRREAEAVLRFDPVFPADPFVH